jgi:putative addiction module CopG family antidote
MQVNLSAENARFIEEQVASGAFRSQSEVLDAGVELLRRRQPLLDRLDEARRQLDEGDFTEYDDEGLRRRFDQLKVRRLPITAQGETTCDSLP